MLLNDLIHTINVSVKLLKQKDSKCLNYKPFVIYMDLLCITWVMKNKARIAAPQNLWWPDRLDNDEFSESHCSVAYKIWYIRQLRVHIVKKKKTNHRSKSNAGLCAGVFNLTDYFLCGGKQMQTQGCTVCMKSKKYKMKVKEIPYPKLECYE